MKRLEEALGVIKEKNKVKEVTNVRFIMVQIQFLLKNVDEVPRIYQELTRKDLGDF